MDNEPTHTSVPLIRALEVFELQYVQGGKYNVLATQLAAATAELALLSPGAKVGARLDKRIEVIVDALHEAAVNRDPDEFCLSMSSKQDIQCVREAIRSALTDSDVIEYLVSTTPRESGA